MATPKKVRTFARQGSKLGARSLTPALRREIAQLRNNSAVNRSTIVARQLGDDRVAIRFRMRTALVSGGAKRDIRPEEPIALVYSADGGVLSTPTVYVDRADFPRDLTHINPVPDDSPVSPCLARAGIQALYERRRIEGVLEHLDDWLLDAKTDSLNRDGWEPLAAGGDPKIGVLDAGFCQQFVEDNKATCEWALGAALLHGDRFVHFDNSSFHQSHGNVASDVLGKLSEELDNPRPTIFLWTPNADTHSHPIFRSYQDDSAFREDLQTLGMSAAFDSAVGQLLVSGWPHGPILLLLAVRRPTPIIADVPGLAEDPTARSLEIRAYEVTAASAKDLLSGSLSIRPISLVQPASRRMAQEVSGASPQRGAVLIGYGALGSSIGEFVARLGASPVDTIDGDVVLPHNTPRHSADFQMSLMPKALVHRDLENRLFNASEVNADGYPGSVQELGRAGLQAKAQNRVILDASADERTRRWLCEEPDTLSTPVLRAEIYHRGRLGVLSVEGSARNPDLLDLYYALCELGMREGSVRNWLRSDREEQAEPSMLTGMSCSSATIALPKWMVAAHASAFMALIQPALEGTDPEPGLGLNPLDTNNEPIGWERHPVSPFAVLESNGWSIRLSAPVVDAIRQMADAATPNETGGYLYGGWDFGLRRITAVYASPLPPGSVATPTSLLLGEAGKTPSEVQLQTFCGTRLELVGSWHSHPGDSSTDLSSTDEATAAKFMKTNRARGLPTLLAVICGDEIAAHVTE